MQTATGVRVLVNTEVQHLCMKTTGLTDNTTSVSMNVSISVMIISKSYKCCVTNFTSFLLMFQTECAIGSDLPIAVFVSMVSVKSA